MPRLRLQSPFPADAWPRVWEWSHSFRQKIADDFGPQTKEEFVAAQLAYSGDKTWAVYRDGELGGLISIEYRTPVLVQCHVLFKKSFWGADTTTRSIRKVWAGLFDAGVIKIASNVFERNHAIIALARSLGAKEEGLLRSQTLQNGLPVNMIALGILKEDFENARYGNRSGTDRRKRAVRGAVQPVEEEHAKLDVDPDVHEHSVDDAGTACTDPGRGSDGPLGGDGTA